MINNVLTRALTENELNDTRVKYQGAKQRKRENPFKPQLG